MTDTKIEWTDRTWNPIRGCSRVSPGCDQCYAMAQAHRFSGMGQPYEGLTVLRTKDAKRPGVDWSGRARFVPEMLTEPLKWRKPQRVFVNSMSDLFHESLTNEEVLRVFAVMAVTPHHTYQVLTKRPERAATWFRDVDLFRLSEQMRYLDLPANGRSYTRIADKWPLPNVWLGVSVENQETADDRIPLLLELPAVVRFISAEPLLGPLSLADYVDRVDHCRACGAALMPQQLDRCPECSSDGGLVSTWGEAQRLLFEQGQRHEALPLRDGPELHWVIVGGESGNGARPFDAAWADSLVRQCAGADVPVFVKQLGGNHFAPWKVEWVAGHKDGSLEAVFINGSGRTELATVWPNGVWHTWDANGVGGENSQEPTVEAAQREALLSLQRQHVAPIKGWARHSHMLRNRKGGDMSEWPEEVRVRQFPEVRRG